MKFCNPKKQQSYIEDFEKMWLNATSAYYTSTINNSVYTLYTGAAGYNDLANTLSNYSTVYSTTTNNSNDLNTIG